MKSNYLDFQVIWEDWNSYKIEGNLIIKVKIPVSGIVEDPAFQSGEKYRFDTDIIQKVQGNIELHEPSSDPNINPEDIKDQINFEPLEERVQIYYIPKNKHIVLLKPVINKVSRTTKYDKLGYPIFWVETNMLLNDVKVP